MLLNKRGENMEKIYICSLLRIDNNLELQEDINQNKRYCRKIALSRKIPFSPHAYFPGFLDSMRGRERALGFTMARHLIKYCDIMYVITRNGEISQDMEKEINKAIKLNIPIEYYSEDEFLRKEDLNE